MQTDPIPIVTVSGDHYHVGQQIGEKLKHQIETLISNLKEDLPKNITWKDMLYQSNLFLSHCKAVFPQYVKELQGIAEGASVLFEEVFLLQCEELWESSLWNNSSLWGHRGCTDFAARGKATIDGSTLLAHTNDLSSSTEDNLVILKIHVEGEPEFLGVSVGGVGFSAGINAAGIGLTGNQVDSNDLRPGVPRLMMVRAILASRRLGEAMNICLLPQRASNYNNVIADSYGEVYSMESSATDSEPIYIEQDILAHANHYVSPPMRRFELDRNAIGDSVIRYNRALRLLRENYGRLSPQLFQNLLADHANYPASICKHEGEAITVFSLIVNLTELRAWIGRGRPCQTHYEEYILEPSSTRKIAPSNH